MLFETARQRPLFAVFICLGVILGIVYDILYLVRRSKKRVLTALCDVLFSFAFLILTLLFVKRFNYGRLQFFLFIAIFSGFFAERATLGFFIKISIDFFMKILYNLFISSPLKKLWVYLTK